MGIVVVAAFAAIAPGVLVAAITFNLALDKIGDKKRQPLIFALRPAIFDDNIAVVDISGVAQRF